MCDLASKLGAGPRSLAPPRPPDHTCTTATPQVAYLTAERDGLAALVADYEAQREVRRGALRRSGCARALCGAAAAQRACARHCQPAWSVRRLQTHAVVSGGAVLAQVRRWRAPHAATCRQPPSPAHPPGRARRAARVLCAHRGDGRGPERRDCGAAQPPGGGGGRSRRRREREVRRRFSGHACRPPRSMLCRLRSPVHTLLQLMCVGGSAAAPDALLPRAAAGLTLCSATPRCSS